MMLCRVAWQVLTDVSAECTAFIPIVQIQSTLHNIRKYLHLQQNLTSGTSVKKNQPMRCGY
jgi:uncharacterized protein YpbB